jgi:hypothetical protein
VSCFSSLGHSSDEREVTPIKIKNAKDAGLTPKGMSMYLAGKVKLSRANETAARANKGQGWK